MTGGSRARAWPVASSAMVGGLYAALTPITALVLLAPANYGHFSIVYLFYAFGISLQYSIVSEAWTRTIKATQVASSWSNYSTALATVCAALAVSAMGAAIVLPDLRGTWWMFGGAVFFAIYRNGARYYNVSVGSSRRVLLSDASGVVTFCVTLAILWSTDPLTRIAGAWFAASLVSVLILRLPQFSRDSGIGSWIRTHSAAIKPLLSDSLLMDAGAIGTPFLLAGFMGATKFGVYRAVSNAALPVRLLVEPVRPNIGRLSPDQLFSRAVSLVVAVTAIGLALLCYFALVYVVPLIGESLGTLSSLVEFAAPTSIYVAGNVLGAVYFIACRTNSSHRAIMLGRVIQTLLVVVLPIGGFLAASLTGAIWGYALSSLLSSFCWLRIALASDVRVRDVVDPSL